VTADSAFVFVVDDDLRVGDALCNLLESSGLRAAAFATAADFLSYEKPDCASCLILDLELPDLNGLEVQQQLAAQDGPPIIFITGRGDVPSSVRAMRAGAVEFLLKPVPRRELLEAVEEALRRDRAVREARHAANELHRRYASLTPREREVLPFVIGGSSNKQTAAKLGNSELTIGVQRGQVMRKMGARSLAELIRMADTLAIRAAEPPEKTRK
jgi:FixJ family two-component response regulator